MDRVEPLWSTFSWLHSAAEVVGASGSRRSREICPHTRQVFRMKMWLLPARLMVSGAHLGLQGPLSAQCLAASASFEARLARGAGQAFSPAVTLITLESDLRRKVRLSWLTL